MKRNRIIRWVIASVLLNLICVSCTNLDEDVSGILSPDNFFKTEADFKTATVAMYRRFSDQYQNAQAQVVMMAGDDITTRPGANKQPFRDFDQFNYGTGGGASDHAWLRLFAWTDYWETIYAANSILENYEASPVSESIKKQAAGEASFMRALSYYFLVRMYGGVPLIANTQATGNEPRATVLKIYQLIESDLKFAEANLKPMNPDAGRATVGAAKTVLSSLYLTWAGWPVKDQSKYALAATKANEVIQSQTYSLTPDFANIWLVQNDNNQESIFSLQYSIEANNYWHNVAQGYRPIEEGGWVDAEAEIGFFNRFPNNYRKDITFYTTFRTNSGPIDWKNSQFKHPTYWKWMAGGTVISNRLRSEKNIDLFRYAEALLIFAEAQVMATGNNSDPAAMEALNKVKRRAAKLPISAPSALVDVNSATQAQIVDERAWELAAEFSRWFDMIRTETVTSATGFRDPSESPILNTPTPKHYMAPIPAFDVQLNPNLIQNPEGFVIQ